ncbi:hypothetical protein [Caldibacillus thermoamylovorans]|uniref:hypothetical protein n=1 Tax=Caldibacillus thermoamylovorans TaxID=35841 RepID=UPI0005A42BC0|nr:hypothetical protein [Caldibacillus thermoamylovorans]
MNSLLGIVTPQYLICSCTKAQKYCVAGNFWCTVTGGSVLKEDYYDCRTGEVCGTKTHGCMQDCGIIAGWT